MKNSMMDGIRELRAQWRMFLHSVKNLWTWLPIIWKDRGWDHSYIYQILAFKLRQQALSMRKNDFIMEAGERADQMEQIAIRLDNLDHNQFMYFENSPYEELDSRYPGIDYKFVPTDETNEYYTLEYVDAEGNIITDTEYVKNYKEERYQLSMKIKEEINAYRAETFKQISDNIECWWW
jgi:hypothetical protein